MKKPFYTVLAVVCFSLTITSLAQAQCTSGGSQRTETAYEAPAMNQSLSNNTTMQQFDWDLYNLPGATMAAYKFTSDQYIWWANSYWAYPTPRYLTVSVEGANGDSVIATGLSPVLVYVSKPTVVKVRSHLNPDCSPVTVSGSYKLGQTLTTVPCTVSYKDTDGDGFGDPKMTGLACPTATPGYVLNSNDCNDSDAKQKPGAKWYPDLDGDGFGDMKATPTISCTKPQLRIEGADIVQDSTDCDDNHPNINSGAEEVLGNNVDENCDGAINLNNSLHFKVIDSANAKNTYLEVENSANMPISTQFTMEFWLKWEDVQGAYIRYLAKKGSMEVYIANGQINVTNGNDSRSFYLTHNQWTHFAISYNSGNVQFYKNGTPYSIFTASLPVNNLTGSALILGHKASDPYSQTFTGSLDEFKMYNKAKTVSEIAQEINKMADTTDSNLLVYYRFDQGKPNGDNTPITTSTNSAGPGYSGKLNNFVMKDKQANFVYGATAFNIAPTPIVTSNEIAENTNASFSVYPNPTTGTFSISSSVELGNVSVYNSLGAMLYQNTTSANQLNIELPSKEAGIYFVKVGNKMTKLAKE